jgi:dihydroorotase-like cyclic amidohydrolase
MNVFEGFQLYGKVKTTYLRGNVVFSNNAFKEKKSGRVIKRREFL